MQCKEKRQHAVCQNETHTASVLISNAALERVLISPLQPVTHNSDGLLPGATDQLFF